MTFSPRQNRTHCKKFGSVDIFFFFHSTLAHICLYPLNGCWFVPQGPLLVPNHQLWKQVKGTSHSPTANPAAHSSPCFPLCPRLHPDLLKIDLSSLQQRLRSSQPPITRPWRSHPSHTDSSDHKPSDKFFFFLSWKEGWWKKGTLQMAQKPNPL